SSEARHLRASRIREIECDFVNLDAFIASAGIKAPDVIKMDVEGAELLVVKGARCTLAKARPVLHLECFAPWQRAFGYAPWDLVSMVQNEGYDFLFACPGGLVAHRPTQANPFPDAFRHGNKVVCLHRDRYDQLRTLIQELAL